MLQSQFQQSLKAGSISRFPQLLKILNRQLSNHSLSEAELNNISRYFLRADKNIDYKLDIWEFNDFTKYAMGRRFDTTDLREIFALYDKNNIGELTEADIIGQWNRRYGKPTRGNVETAFCTYDKNDDGFIKLHEFRQALYYLGLPAGHKGLTKVFEKYDTDNDRHITFQQFKDIIEKEVPQFNGT